MNPQTKSQLEAELQTAREQIARLERALMQAEANREKKAGPLDQAGETSQLEKKFHRLLEILPVGVSILNAENEVVFSNQSLQDILQISEDELANGSYRNRRYLAVDGSPMPAEGFASVQASKNGQPVYNVETGIVKEEGETIWTSVSAVPMDFPDWKTVIVTTDITARKQAETRMLDAEALYRALYETSLDGLSVFDSKMNIVLSNRRSAEIYGFDSPEAMIGLNALHFLPPEEQTRAVELARNRRSDSTHFDEFRLRRRDGTEFFGETSSIAIPDQDGNPSGLVLGMVRDITERKLLEENLRESEQRYTLLFEKLSVPAILLKLPEVVIADVNEACERLTGFTRLEMLGRTTVDLGMLKPEKRVQAISEFEKQGSLSDKETRLYTKSGEERVVVSNTNPVTIGRQPHAITTLQDITRRKQVEEKLAESESRFATIFENSPVAIGISNLTDGKITDVNTAFLKLYGFTREEVLGRTTTELDIWAIPEDRQRFIDQLRIGDSVHNLESVAHSKSGMKLHVLISGEKVEINGKPSLVAQTLDITEREQAELKRNRLTERLDLATRSARMGIWDWDIQKNEILWDDQMYALYGLKPGEFGGAYEAWLHGVHPEDRETSNEASSAAVRGEQEYDTEFRVLWPDGSVHWIKANGQVFRDENGTPLRMVGVNYDITERKGTEQKLIRQAEQLREQAELLEYAHVLVRDIDNRIVTWNQGMEKLYGWTKDEAIGHVTHTFFQTIFPASQEEYQAELMQSGHWEGELTHINKYGVKLTVASHHTLYYDPSGNPYLILEVNNDITGRKLAEDALRLSEENFARAFATNPSALTITRRVDGRFIIINEAYTSVMGYTPVEIMGHDVSEFSIYADPQERGQLLQKLAEQGRVSNYELTVRKKNREFCQILISMEPIVYNNEDCILSAFVDITERKKMEDELRRSNAELEQFAYIASHDLQEPLRALTGMVQLLQRRYQGQLDERADEYIGHAVDAAGRMQALIQALLSYSRVDRRNQPLGPVDAGECLQAALRNLGVSIRESHAIITADDMPVVMADPTQLVQLFQNLVGNSLKFRGERQPQIQISVSRLQDAWWFSVRDNGIGIEPQYFERIFLVFQRLHTRREYPGTGIGLALCKKIVERHGGSIWVESTYGEGSAFYFTLPMRSMDHE